MRCSAKTDIGRRRSNNQDGFYVGDNWCVVADGMGGHNGGEVASRTAIEVIKAALRQQTLRHDLLLKEAISRANNAIYAMALEDPSLEGMGTTAVLCLLEEHEAVFAHVGDSRAYHLRGDQLVQITSDHSIVQQLIDCGTITRSEAKTHPQKNLITRAIGTEADIQTDVCRVPFSPGDYFLLCSDGLSALVGDCDIKKNIQSAESTAQAVERLVDLANENGGTDNITVILIEL